MSWPRARRCRLAVSSGASSRAGLDARRVDIKLAGVAAALASLGLVLAWTPPASAESASTRRAYAIKAGFVFKFIEYIDWPAASPPVEDPEITLCMLGDDPFGTALAPLHGKVVKGVLA